MPHTQMPLVHAFTVLPTWKPAALAEEEDREEEDEEDEDAEYAPPNLMWSLIRRFNR